MESILDVLRSEFSPNVLEMRSEGKVFDAHGYGCDACGHEGETFTKKRIKRKRTKDTKILCAACLSMTANMPSHSVDGGKPIATKKRGGLGVLLTQHGAHWYLPEKVDALLFDDLSVTRIGPVLAVSPVLIASIPDVLALPENTPYWWGLLQSDAPYSLIERLHRDAWDITQPGIFSFSLHGDRISDNSKSWMARRELLRLSDNKWKSAVNDLKEALCESDPKKKDRIRKRFKSKIADFPSDRRLNLSCLSNHALRTFGTLW